MSEKIESELQPTMPPSSKPQRKMPRDAELRMEIVVVRKAIEIRVENLQADFRKKRSDALIASTSKVGAFSREREAKVAELCQKRDQMLRDAKKALDKALREVQGDYDKAVNAIKSTFEADRAVLDDEVSAKSAPLREEFEKTEAALKQKFADQVQSARALGEERVQLLAAELKAIEDKRLKTVEVKTEAVSGEAK